MSEYQLNENLYIGATPAGAYYGTSAAEGNPSRRLLRALFLQDFSPLLTREAVRQWSEAESEDAAMDLLFHAQKIGWVEGYTEPLAAPQGSLEDVLPELLVVLSSQSKALLADTQGFYVCSQGFPHETAEALSALSANIASLHERHQRLLGNNLGLETSAWALVEASGSSRIGFWPLFIGEQRFVLVIAGNPQFNQPALTSLVWALSKRYGV